MSEPIEDVLAPRPVVASEIVFRGKVWDLVGETVDLAGEGQVVRQFVQHPGAVGVLALDEHDRVLFVRQYRHPVGYELYELPAGLLDVAGEPPVDSARRELLEETDLRADRWDLLIDWFNSPGGSDEAFRLFLARDLHPVADADRHRRTEEEAAMTTHWVDLDEAQKAVLTGRLHNPTTVVGILAAVAARERGWTSLRPVDDPWPQHKSFR